MSATAFFASLSKISGSPYFRSFHSSVRRHRRSFAPSLSILLALAAPCASFSAEKPIMNPSLSSLPVLKAESSNHADWLVHPLSLEAGVFRNGDGDELILDNGLIRRSFRLAPNAACVAFDNLMTEASLLRAVKPEATLEIDGENYAVGGLTGQPDLGYLRPDWLNEMKSDPNAFAYSGFEIGETKERFAWKRTSKLTSSPWPPKGVSLTLKFNPPAGKLPGLSVEVHYELYDGLPIVSKWVTLKNDGATTLTLDRFASEILGIVEAESIVDSVEQWDKPGIAALTDYSFGGMSIVNSVSGAVHWETDPEYGTQVNYSLKTPCVLTVHPTIGPDARIPAGGSFETIRAFEVVFDSDSRERRGLTLRKAFRALAPWAMENPLMLHLTDSHEEAVRHAIDQCAEVGFERVILSFGSGLNMEDVSPENIAKYKALADYAHSKGISLGGYSLLASRRIDDENDVINPKTGKTGGAIFGNSPCLQSRWGIEYFKRIRQFLSETGFDLLEHDGSYPGDLCASTNHPGHRGLDDSQWTQYREIADFYEWCRGKGISLNVPDFYFMVGSTKAPMGYRETNWSLPRSQQFIHARQNLFDGTWEKTPSMGWMFTPLVEYQGGGAAATIEPLSEHLADYERHLENNLGYGAQACYRGPRLYDAEETKALVIRWVSWYKKHRAILESDVIHLRRADGRDMDGILHVNPESPEKGLAVFFNPTDHEIVRETTLPLYYAGLTETAKIAEGDGEAKTYPLDRERRAKLKIRIPANGMSWYVIR